ncbi:MAG: DUF3499 family protein [Actinomycetota bacterium]
MSRSCEKQGCNKPAEVAFGIDRMACIVWLENYDEDEPRHLNRLCDEHAARLTLPRGWSFDDRRERSPRLFVASHQRAKSEVARKSAAKPRTKPRKRANKTGPIPRRTSRDTSAPLKRMDGPGLFDPTLPMDSPRLASLSTEPVVAAVDIAVDTVAVDTTAPAYAPKFDRTSDVGGALNATGRLLRRAFSSQTKPIERPTSDDDTTSQRRASNTDSLPQGDHIDDFNQGDHVE